MRITPLEDQTSSASPPQQLCQICQQQFANYTCPRCNLRYCSLACYKNEEHSECTESFYKESIEAEINSGRMDDREKERMLQVLRRFEAQDDADTDLDQDYNDIMDRLESMNLEEADAQEIWNLLPEKEREKFNHLIQALHVGQEDKHDFLWDYVPWWQTAPPKERHIQEIDEDDDASDDDESDTSVHIPSRPASVPAFDTLYKSDKPPGAHLGWNLLNLLMTYCYTMRHLLGDLQEDLQRTIQVIQTVSANVLFSFEAKCVYNNVEDVLVDIAERICILEDHSEENAPKKASQNALDSVRFTKLKQLLLDDALALLKQQDHAYLQRALADLGSTLDLYTTHIKKRKAIVLASRKLMYYLSYANHIQTTGALKLLIMLVQSERESMTIDQQQFRMGQQAAEQARKGHSTVRFAD